MNNKMTADCFSERLKQLRIKKGLSAKALAIDANIPYSTYIKYESNKATPTAPVIIAIAKALQISTDELLGYTLDVAQFNKLCRELIEIGCNVQTMEDEKIKVIAPTNSPFRDDIEYTFNNRIDFVRHITNALNDPDLPIQIYTAKRITIRHYLQQLTLCTAPTLNDTARLQEFIENSPTPTEEVQTALNNLQILLNMVKEKAPASEPTANKD